MITATPVQSGRLAQTNGHTPQTLPLEAIKPWPGNPRKNFPESDLAELAESIKKIGVRVPVLVRPAKDNRPVLDDFTLLSDIAGCDTDPRSSECAEELQNSFLIVTYGDWKKRQVLAGMIGGRPMAVAKVRALAKAIEALEKAGPKKQLYELADGERRFRAAQLAGLTEIPVIVRELTDVEVLELALLTREQSRDLRPMEKAEGYRRLVVEHGKDVAAVALAVGCSATMVRQALAIAGDRLPDLAREAVEEGVLPASTAALIAGVSTTFLRERVATCAVKGFMWHDADSFNDPKVKIESRWRDTAGCLSFRDTKDLIERVCQVELKGAPFSRTSLDLVEAAGSCDACPKRMGNLQTAHPGEYDGVRADVCTDPPCYRLKVEAASEQALAAAKAKGLTVLQGKETKDIFGYGGRLSYDAKFVELEGKCQDDPKKRTYRKLVGKELADAVVVAVDQDGHAHNLLRREQVVKALKAKGIGTKAANLNDDKWERQPQAQEAAQRQKAELGGRAALLANGKVAELVDAAASAIVGWTPELLKLLRLLAVAQTHFGMADACRMICKRRGLTTTGTAGGDPCSVVELIRRLDNGPELLGLIAEIAAARPTLDWKSWYSSGDGGKSWLTELGIVRSELVKQVKAGKRSLHKAAKGKARASGESTAAKPEQDTAVAELDPYQVPLADFITRKPLLGALHLASLKTIRDLYDRAAMSGQPLSSCMPGLTLCKTKEVFDLVRMELKHAGVPSCRACGCTEDYCEWCCDDDGNGCEWAALDLCSACPPI